MVVGDRPRRRGDEGQVFPAVVTVIAGFVAFTVFVIVPMGSAVDRQAEVRTAADAAALAALSEIGADLHGIGTLVPPGLGGSDEEGSALDAVLGDLETSGYYAAREYAERNDAELVDYDLDMDLPYIQVYAATRSEDQVEDTDLHTTADATARMEVLSGLCSPPGEAIGLELEDGDCRGLGDLLDPLPPVPEPPPAPQGPGGPTPPAPPPVVEEPDLPGLSPIVVDDPVLVE